MLIRVIKNSCDRVAKGNELTEEEEEEEESRKRWRMGWKTRLSAFDSLQHLLFCEKFIFHARRSVGWLVIDLSGKVSLKRCHRHHHHLTTTT